MQSCSSDDSSSNQNNFPLNFGKAYFGPTPACLGCNNKALDLILTSNSISYIEEDSNGNFVGNFVGNGPILEFSLQTNDDNFITPGAYTLTNGNITPMTYDYGTYIPNLATYLDSTSASDIGYEYFDNCFIEISYNQQNQIIVNYELDLYDINGEFATRIEDSYTGSYTYIEELPWIYGD